MKKNVLVIIVSLLTLTVKAEVKTFSTAGFYTLANSGRTVENLNPGWRFTKDSTNDLAERAFKTDFCDTSWQAVALPNGMEYLPLDASGGVNYQGGAWYRKTFNLPETYSGKRTVIYFEAIMGKSKVWVNGELVKEHFGGFLPVAVDVTKQLKAGAKNLVAVWCDNSNDPIYPPGKPQEMLDFCYFGGIYRDCWLIATDRNTYITDENMAEKVAGGGIFISYPQVSDDQATIAIKTDLVGGGKVTYTLKDHQGRVVCSGAKPTLVVKKPNLWSPQAPYLYDLEVVVKDRGGKTVDGLVKKIGIRDVKFSHTEGLILNGKPYPRKLIGANRHQDFAVVGNALSNNLHWRDVKKLKEAGLEVVRNAHYPQDPAFMDACDELGLFVIVNTPGWQFWNPEPIFEQRVYNDIRQMVRRDRSRPSLFLWEPILNETYYPEPFAHNTHNIIKQEASVDANSTAADEEARGSHFFDVIFRHPTDGEAVAHKVLTDSSKVYFTREWGDNVDDWNSHNSPSRVARNWGENPQLIQAKHYANPSYLSTSYDNLLRQPAHHFGGTLWHSFDHQRGYHPDPFYGGIMDAFRRPKYSYKMFQAQTNLVEPMVYIANEMSPFSPEDVTVFTNCDAVRLRTYFGDTLRVKRREGQWVTFDGAFNFMADKALSRSGKQASSSIVAEGLNAVGEVVATDRRTMARRPVKLQLVVDTLGASPVADGGDLVVVTAQMVDGLGVIKRLNNAIVRFEIEGQGRIIGSAQMQTNPVPVEWGEASILVRMTTTAGVVKVRAEVVMAGDNTPMPAEVIFRSKPLPYSQLFDSHVDEEAQKEPKTEVASGVKKSDERRAEIEKALREVEKQQESFGEKRD